VTAQRARDVARPRIRHLLFDADGVIQSLPGGWYTLMERYVGQRAQEFLHGAWKQELPLLAGQGDYLPLLAARLAEFGVSAPVEEVYRDVRQRIEPDRESLGLVRALRASGYRVHLGTNQERNRAAHMRNALGYDALFDVCCYLGVAKPDPAFFAAAARRIAAQPASILFIDDAPGTSRAPAPPDSPASSGNWGTGTTSCSRHWRGTASAPTPANRSGNGASARFA
jgi:putative hydrolase of the HAD superfamily